MSSNIVPFDFDGAQVRVVTIDDEPWFVAADVASILGYRMASDMTRALDDDERGTRPVRTPSGEQDMTVLSEGGLWRAIVARQTGRICDEPTRERIRTFQRWVTHDVLPQIRRTGSYGTPALTGPELLAHAVIEAQAMIQAREAQVAELTPRAEAWDALAATDGDYSMRDAAQILCRDHGVDIGQNRLAKRLREIGWVDPQGIPYQRHVDLGRLRSRARYYTHARTQERVLADPQIRITPKGVADLRTILATKEISA